MVIVCLFVLIYCISFSFFFTLVNICLLTSHHSPKAITDRKKQIVAHAFISYVCWRASGKIKKQNAVCSCLLRYNWIFFCIFFVCFVLAFVGLSELTNKLFSFLYDISYRALKSDLYEKHLSEFSTRLRLMQ